MNATCILDARSVLAEGPVWHQNRLWWVDIERGEVHAFSPQSDRDRHWRFPHRIGFVIPTQKGDFLVGTDRGIARFHPDHEDLQFVAHPEPDIPGNRFNDAKCDAAGRLWAGTMAIDESPERGSLYRLNTDLSLARTVSKVSISNGLAWSPDGRTLYYIDSPTRKVDAFDFEPTEGALSRRRTIIEVTDGFPDGMAIDHQGRLWIALWGGWCVACYDPGNGQRVQQIDVPVEAVSSCCFGPEDTLYITTASRDVTEATRARQPQAGGIFAAHVGVSGPTPPLFTA